MKEINESHNSNNDGIVTLSGLYREWFLDYASYVILERAVPAIEDGLKPVQRRILHSLKELDDGRYNKVANVIGNTMKYHPHGDASIGDAMVQLGQKDLLIDCQGNWGNTLTGDSAAAPRYIEARLTKFALHVAFNAKTTNWQLSYDGRNKEPINLPMKFPLLLAQGAEGIAVGLACKMLPHNFMELIDQSINHLRGKRVEIFPDFPNGGMADVSNYNDGLRGGKVRVRAKIKKEDSKTLVITEIPFGTTTDSLIESIVKANDKGKIKVKKIEDNTSSVAEIIIHLAPGVSPDKMIDALYAFTDCEVSISPNGCVIIDKKPVFLGVSDILKMNTETTVHLLRRELEIKKSELEEQWHFASLEKIFIEKRIYRRIEEEETWEGVISTIHKGLQPHTKHLKRKVTDDDVVKLTDIKIKRISKFDALKADEFITKLEEELEKVENNLAHLIDYAIDYFKDLKTRFGEGRERKTELKHFDNIAATKVIVANKKLYVDKEEGFVGWGLRKDEYISECSDIDDIVVFFETGKVMVSKIADKKFVGKGIIHCAVWKKGDKRTIYHLIYQDGANGDSYMKRFNLPAVTRDKEYDLTKGTKGSKVMYFSANPNGRREVVSVMLRPRPNLKKARFDVDFGELIIKGRGAAGNRVTKEKISKVLQKEVGGSTLSARKVWWDEVVSRLNDEGRGIFLGEFKGEDKILTIYKTGEYLLTGFELATKFDEDLIHIEKWHPNRPISCVYFDATKDMYFVKRFFVEPSRQKVLFISENEGSQLVIATTQVNPRILISFNKHLKATKNLPDKEELLNSFIDIKGLKAQGNQLTKLKVKSVELLPSAEDWPKEQEDSLESSSDDEEIEETIGQEIESDDYDDYDDEDEPLKNIKIVKVEKQTTDDIEFEITNESDATKGSFEIEKKSNKKKTSRKDNTDSDDQMTLF
jgi:topoisomerase IV subunit A